MRKIPVIVLAIALLSGIAHAAAPYPYGEYELETTGNLEQVYREVEAKYTVLAQSEKSSTFPWDKKSYARLQAPEVVEARVNFDAAHKFMSDDERKRELEKMRSIYIDNAIEVVIGLYSVPGISGGYGYTEINGYSSYVARVIMETDDGRRFEPLRVYSGTSSLSGRQWWAFNSVTFPRYDEDGNQIINENTKWVKLWIISHTERIFFEFAFRNQ